MCDDSTAGRLGISRGDVIVSYNGLRDFTLHTVEIYDCFLSFERCKTVLLIWWNFYKQFEEYLLNLGWGFLESTDPSWTINLEVYFIIFLVLRILKLTTENIIYFFACSLRYMILLDVLSEVLPSLWDFLIFARMYVTFYLSVLFYVICFLKN